MAACFAAILLLDAFGLLLKIVELGAFSEYGNLLLSMISNFVLLMGGLELLDEDKLMTESFKRFIVNTFPLGMICYVVLNHPLDSALLSQFKVLDSAASISACLFLGLTLYMRLILREEYFLAGLSSLSFMLWAGPEMFYWSSNTIGGQIAMGLGGCLVALVATMAAYRRVV
jgi:hypothetical protein